MKQRGELHRQTLETWLPGESEILRAVEVTGFARRHHSVALSS